jgi:hypothetical protein
VSKLCAGPSTKRWAVRLLIGVVSSSNLEVGPTRTQSNEGGPTGKAAEAA